MVETVNTPLNRPKNFKFEDIKYSMRQDSLEKWKNPTQSRKWMFMFKKIVFYCIHV